MKRPDPTPDRHDDNHQKAPNTTSESPILLKLIIDRYTAADVSCHYPATVDGLIAVEAMHVYDVLTEAFPSVNWVLPKPFAEEKVKRHEKNARWSLEQLAKAKHQRQPDLNTVHPAFPWVRPGCGFFLGMAVVSEMCH